MTGVANWARLGLLSWLLAGCELLFQAGPGLTVGRDEYLNSIKPYIAYWHKEGMTKESRRVDSVSCRSGGIAAGGIYKPEFEKARLPGETEGAAYNRLILNWERCMLRAGYRYTGNCSIEWKQTRPACGAP